MTSFALRTASPAKTRAEAVVVGVVPGEGGRKGTARLAPGGEDVAKAYGRRFSPLLASLGLSGKPGEVAKVPTNGAIASPLLVLVGLGADPDPLAVRRAAGAAARAVTNSASVALALPADTPELLRAALEGYRLGGYTFTRYKSGSSGSAPAEIVVLSPVARRKDSISAFDEAQFVVDAVVTARDWVNTPPGDLTPALFADEIVAATKRVAGVTAKVYDEAQLAELGCGGILGVGAGSDAPPRLVELDYRPKGATTHLALVGKGITFDSGGLTIKPAASMPTMKEDMAGAAAVVQAVLTAARLKLPVRITAIAALAENMVGGASFRPGDVLTTYDGTTVEITNTDAEGRLVLADALGRAVKRKPDLIVDIATLTAHMSLALGDKMCAVMGDDAIVEQVLAAAVAGGEEAWPMPIPEHMEERIRTSRIADLSQHDWIRWGGGLFAGAFLREFTGGLPWAHLDIAGPAFNKGGPAGHWTSGATGYGVATLVELARSLADRPED
ncbi:leucyl aminopeptidase [Nocardioides bizhenqiangii]|uniref:Probable cytosol aminopeptidase n=1 Tax=Nocardioides bizhenqiangii TaxID=3095076 RepID=A0ABZ0ZVX0_9ACTN|nr:leucyl aminopeptidase [Nocardioides sp. HM61]WQQ28480.1 leucyl aminopeptidase [Nocardioides sp. HM61]